MSAPPPRHDVARTRALLSAAQNADDQELVETCRKALDGSPLAVEEVWTALHEADEYDE